MILRFPKLKAERTAFPKQLVCAYEANDKYQFYL